MIETVEVNWWWDTHNFQTWDVYWTHWRECEEVSEFQQFLPIFFVWEFHFLHGISHRNRWLSKWVENIFFFCTTPSAAPSHRHHHHHESRKNEKELNWACNKKLSVRLSESITLFRLFLFTFIVATHTLYYFFFTVPFEMWAELPSSFFFSYSNRAATNFAHFASIIIHILHTYHWRCLEYFCAYFFFSDTQQCRARWSKNMIMTLHCSALFLWRVKVIPISKRSWKWYDKKSCEIHEERRNSHTHPRYRETSKYFSPHGVQLALARVFKSTQHRELKSEQAEREEERMGKFIISPCWN